MKPLKPKTSLGHFHLGMGATGIAVVAFSFGPIIVKDAGLEALPLAFWRLWMGVGYMALLMLSAGRRITLNSLKHSVLPGLFFCINISLFFSSVKLTSIANATLINILQPLPLFIVGAMFFGERFKKMDTAWGVLAISGTAILVAAGSDGVSTNLWGDFLAFLAMLAFSAYFAASKKSRQKVDTREFLTGTLLVAAVAMTPVSFLSGDPMLPEDGGRTWILLLLMTFIPGSGHLMINYAHRYVPLYVVSLLQLMAPILSTGLAWVILEESLNLTQLLGVAMSLLALSLFTFFTAKDKDGKTTPEKTKPS